MMAGLNDRILASLDKQLAARAAGNIALDEAYGEVVADLREQKQRQDAIARVHATPSLAPRSFTELDATLAAADTPHVRALVRKQWAAAQDARQAEERERRSAM